MMTMAGVPGHPAMHSVLSALVHPPACLQAWCLTRGALENSLKALFARPDKQGKARNLSAAPA